MSRPGPDPGSRRLISRLRAVPDDRMHLGLMLALTFGTGVADAVGYLGLDRVFTGNMTGNVLILGMGLAGGDLPVLGPALALVGFLAGATLGGRVLRHAAGSWTDRTTVLFGAVGLAMLALAVLLFVGGEDPPRPVSLTVSTGLAAVMGVQAAAARLVAIMDVTTVVVTSTLTGLALDSVLGRGHGTRRARRVAAVVLLLAGAAAGTGLLRWHLGAGPLLTGAVVLTVTAVGALHRGTDPPATAAAAR